MNKIDLNSFDFRQDFYESFNLVVTVKSFDLQSIRKRYLDSKKNSRSGSVERRDVALGGVVSLRIEKGKVLEERILTKLKEPRGIDLRNGVLAFSSENTVYVIDKKMVQLENPWFSYIHTVSLSPFNGSNLLISSSGFDCIFEYDYQNNDLLWEWFAWENGFDLSKAPLDGKELRITRNKKQSIAWDHQNIDHLFIDKPSVQVLPTAKRTAFINSVEYHQSNTNVVVATLFHHGNLIKIDKNTQKHQVILTDLLHPHGGIASNDFVMATSTNSGEVVIKQGKEELRYFFNNIKGKPSEISEMEWLQNSKRISEHLYLTIDSNRTSFILFDTKHKCYDVVPFNDNWAVQDLAFGKLTEFQTKELLQLTNPSN